MKQRSRMDEERRSFLMRNLSLWILVILIVTTALSCYFRLGDGGTGYIQDYDGAAVPMTGWKLITDGAQKDISLPVLVEAGAGDTVTVCCIIPSELPESPALVFPTEMQDVTVGIDGDIVYEWNNADTRKVGKASPPTTNIVPLPADCADKKLTVTFTSPYAATSGQIPQVSYGNLMQIRESLTVTSLPGYICCLGIIFLGVIMYIIMFFISLNSTVMSPLRDICLFSIIMGVYLLCMIEMPLSFPVGDCMRMNLGYLAFMLFPLPFIAYTYERTGVAMRTVYGIFFTVFVLNFVAALTLQLTDIADLYETAVVSRFLLIILMAVSFGDYTATAIRKHSVYVICEYIGLIVLYCAGIFQYIVYYTGTSSSGTVLLFGMTVFIICIVVSVTVEAVSVSRERARLRHEIERQKLLMMSSQMRPHFLYNALLAIQEMCYDDPHKAADAIVVFSSYLRVNIDSLKLEGCIPFGDEMRHIENYIRIERMRFGDTLKLTEALEVTDFEVPPLSIQPLVENAVRHGIRARYGEGTVCVRTRSDGDYIVLTVEDDGVGMPAEVTPERALRTVRARLSDALGATVGIESVPGQGTKVTIRFLKPGMADTDSQDSKKHHRRKKSRTPGSQPAGEMTT